MAAAPFRSFDLAPPLPARPIQWRRAWQLLRELIRDPSSTDKVFELFEAAGGIGDEPTVQEFSASPEGRRMFTEKPQLLPHLADRKGLAALPPRSFGRAYLAFAERNGFAADGLLEANQKGLGQLNAQLDPERRWFFERANLMHDLWHVLTGYDVDTAGEAALLGFSLSQGLASRTLKLLYGASLIVGPKRERLAFQRFVLRARRRGREAAPLFLQPYEELLPRPLEEVRRELRIRPIREVHPDGIFRAVDGGMREMKRVTV